MRLSEIQTHSETQRSEVDEAKRRRPKLVPTGNKTASFDNRDRNFVAKNQGIQRGAAHPDKKNDYKRTPKYKKDFQEGLFGEKSGVKFNSPVAVKAVNLINAKFKEYGQNNIASLLDKFTIELDSVPKGIEVDVVDGVINELGGGMYTDGA